jgi:hypothetical protein
MAPAGAKGVDDSTNDPRWTTCSHPVPFDAMDDGFERCDSGVVHRASIHECSSNIDPARPVPGLTSGECQTPADCTARPHGYCTFAGQSATTVCAYGCVRDSECGAGSICYCGATIGTCVKASCAEDADCPDHLMCLESTAYVSSCSSTSHFGCGPICHEDSDCKSMNGGEVFCVQGNCSETGPACGRPFLVEGAARVASPDSRVDFMEVTTPDVERLSAPARLALAAHYAHAGLMEHASVAAFARFVLELLAAGAPSELVDAAGEAMRDELRHTQICFGLASAYAGAPMGPGPLDTVGALDPVSFEARLTTVFLEACVGETVAAFQAAEAAGRATDPVVSTALGRIAEDEMRHAALGFRFVGWALGTLDAERRAVMVAELLESVERQRAPHGSAVAACDDTTLIAHGLLPESVLREVRAAALEDVVVPCTRAATVTSETLRRSCPRSPRRW